MTWARTITSALEKSWDIHSQAGMFHKNHIHNHTYENDHYHNNEVLERNII